MGTRDGLNNEGGPRNEGEMRDPNRSNQLPRPNWDRGNTPSGQLGGNPVVPPVIADRTDGRGNDGRGNDRRWNDGRGNNGQFGGTWGSGDRRDEARRNEGWRGNDRQWDRQGGRLDDRHYENRNPQRWGESRDWNGRGWNGGGWDNRGWNGRGWNNRDGDGRAWNRDWRRDQRYDWQRWRYSNRDTFRARPYYAPYDWNYGYRRFSIGFSLTRILFDQRYWIQDPYSYRLPPAYGAYRWVRYYDDVLLVDVRTGQVVDAIYDFFW